MLSNDCIKAIEKFQCSMTRKEQYLAFYARKNISISIVAMISIHEFVIKLIQICHIQICYIEFCVNLDMFRYEFVSKIQIVLFQFVHKMTAGKIT